MGSVMNVEAAILARITKRVKIVLIGNPLPVIKHPLRMAEELATIDLISRGRLVTGWVRGAGSEQFFNNANPAYNREMFEEAHDFIVQAWTRPGPWRYEGKHFHYRHVNPWALPYQKPHPPMSSPGCCRPETVRWSAETGLPVHRSRHVAGADGRPVGPLRRCRRQPRLSGGAGELRLPHRLFVADTDEKAQELGKGFIFGGGQSVFAARVHLAAGLQLEGSDPPPGADAERWLGWRQLRAPQTSARREECTTKARISPRFAAN